MGTVGSIAVLRYSSAAASVGLCWILLWTVGLASTFDSGDYTPTLGLFYGNSGQFYGHAESNHYGLAVVETFGPFVGIMAIAATVAWWGVRRAGRRSAGLFAALLGPAFVFVAYLIVGPGNENAEPWDGAYSLLLLSVMAAAVAAISSAWRQTRRSWPFDALIVILALVGVTNEVVAALFPISPHYHDGGASLSLMILLLLLTIPPCVDLWQIDRPTPSTTEASYNR